MAPLVVNFFDSSCCGLIFGQRLGENGEENKYRGVIGRVAKLSCAGRDSFPANGTKALSTPLVWKNFFLIAFPNYTFKSYIKDQANLILKGSYLANLILKGSCLTNHILRGYFPNKPILAKLTYLFPFLAMAPTGLAGRATRLSLAATLVGAARERVHNKSTFYLEPKLAKFLYGEICLCSSSLHSKQSVRQG